jgi:hypothetical protein
MSIWNAGGSGGLGYATSSRRGALHARILFAVAVTAAMVWLSLRALSWSV